MSRLEWYDSGSGKYPLIKWSHVLPKSLGLTQTTKLWYVNVSIFRSPHFPIRDLCLNPKSLSSQGGSRSQGLTDLKEAG